MPCNAMRAPYTIEMQDPVMREYSIWSMTSSQCDEAHSYFCAKFWVNIAWGINYHKDRDCLFNNAVRNSCPLSLCSTPQQLQIIGYQATREIPLLQKCLNPSSCKVLAPSCFTCWQCLINMVQTQLFQQRWWTFKLNGVRVTLHVCIYVYLCTVGPVIIEFR